MRLCWLTDCCWPIVFQYQQLRNQTKEKNGISCAIYSFARCRQEVQLSSFYSRIIDFKSIKWAKWRHLETESPFWFDFSACWHKKDIREEGEICSYQMHAIQNLNVVKMFEEFNERGRRIREFAWHYYLCLGSALCMAHALRPFPNSPEPAWNGPNGMGQAAVRSVIIKLRSAFHVSRPSARNHLSFVDDDCRAGPAAPPSLFLLPSPHEPRHTLTKFMQHAKKMK